MAGAGRRPLYWRYQIIRTFSRHKRAQFDWRLRLPLRFDSQHQPYRVAL